MGIQIEKHGALEIDENFEHRLRTWRPTRSSRPGQILKERMDKCRVDERENLTAARLTQSLARMDQIQYAIL